MRKLKKRGNMNDRIDVVLRKFRSRMTSYPPGMCPLALYRSLLQISMNQSCGKCIPCRDGLGEVDYMLKSILNGDATMETLDIMEKKCRMIAETADCAVGVVGETLCRECEPDYPLRDPLSRTCGCPGLYRPDQGREICGGSQGDPQEESFPYSLCHGMRASLREEVPPYSGG